MGKEINLSDESIKALREAIGTTEPAQQVDGMDYVIVRTYSAGVHAGYLKERNGREVTLLDSRRLYYWDGAFTLSTVATKGVSKPDNCKFPDVVPEILLLEAVEIIPCSEEARLNIKNVPVWKNS